MNILIHLNQTEIQCLCDKINMPQLATDKVIMLINDFDFAQFSDDFDELLTYTTGYNGFKSISDSLKESENAGFIWLTISLSGALIAQEKYTEMGISNEIFYDTMSCFSRFVKEYYDSFGVYGFDRAFWSYRQLSQTIYRLGTLEFELVAHEGDDILKNGEVVIKKGENIVSIHIPSDAKINICECDKSYSLAKDFIGKYYPDFSYKVFYCESWLMSPNLKYVLPSHSNILQFQSAYDFCTEYPDDTSYDLWVFKESGLAVEEWAEDTSLQRNIKTYVQSGKKLSAGDGIINIY